MYLLCSVKHTFLWIMKSTFQEMIRRDWSCLNPCVSATSSWPGNVTASRVDRTRHHKTWSTPISRPVAIPNGTFVEDRTIAKLVAPALAGIELQENSQSSLELLAKGFEGRLSRHQLHLCASVAQVSNVDVRRRSDRMRLKLPWPDLLDPAASMNCQLLRSSQVSNSSSGPASLGFTFNYSWLRWTSPTDVYRSLYSVGLVQRNQL